MKGIYLTEEGKKAIEDRISEIEKSKMILQRAVSTDPNFGEMQRTAYTKYCTEVDAYKEILSSATILPVEKNWDGVFNKTFSQAYIEKDYPNGVIIQPKQ